MKERNLPEVVEIVWEDTMTQHGWNKHREALEVTTELATTVGFLVEDAADAIRVSASAMHIPEKEFARSSRFDCVTVIPKSAVRSMRQMRKARK